MDVLVLEDKQVQFGAIQMEEMEGKAGDFNFIADPNMSTLVDFTPNKLFEAQDGGKGMPENAMVLMEQIVL